ncbi:MAG: PD-(D/E)XK nuclease-like domain-containing protein [Pseudoalteromonas sp.]
MNQEFIQTPAMVLGSAVHTAILEPESFSSEYVVAPKCDRRTKAGKEIWANFTESAGNKTVLAEWEYEVTSQMKNAVLSHPMANKMLTGGESEYSYFTEFEGVEVKCRPDYLKNGCLIDLKTTADASYEGFAKQMGNLAYHLQAAFYVDVFNKATGSEIKDFYFVAVENKKPYAVAVYRLDEPQIEAGRLHYQIALEKYRSFLAQEKELGEKKALQNHGYSNEILDIQIPYWFLDKINY